MKGKMKMILNILLIVFGVLGLYGNFSYNNKFIEKTGPLVALVCYGIFIILLFIRLLMR
jgi:hypothetical protein